MPQEMSQPPSYGSLSNDIIPCYPGNSSESIPSYQPVDSSINASSSHSRVQSSISIVLDQFQIHEPLKFYKDKHENNTCFHVKVQGKTFLTIVFGQDKTVYLDNIGCLIGEGAQLHDAFTAQKQNFWMLSDSLVKLQHNLLPNKPDQFLLILNYEKPRKYLLKLNKELYQVYRESDHIIIARFKMEPIETKEGALTFLVDIDKLDMLVITYAIGYSKRALKYKAINKNPLNIQDVMLVAASIVMGLS